MQVVNKINYPEGLPISTLRQTIIEHIGRHKTLIVAGETGSGKTTQLPKMCLEAGLGRKKLIGCTQPRRIAASSVALRVAEELGESCGSLVGYKVRFSDHTGRATRIKFMTDGMLLAEAAKDRRLNRYEAVIIDEAHERGLNIDFLLGILKRLQSQRDDLRVIISSATLDTDKFSKHFDDAPVISIPGKTYPVEVRYEPNDTGNSDNEQSYLEQAVASIKDLARHEPPGDVLLFLPTERDILEAAEMLQGQSVREGSLLGDTVVLPLFGRLSSREQHKIFRPHKKRKIVIATNVAETSITVPGIRYVVDSGLARISSYNPRSRTTKLPIRSISAASADQRKGRCGRVGPGVCIRLYSEENYQGRERFTAPEIVRANLADVILRMVDLNLGHPARFPFLDPPSPRSIKDGFNLLNELGAIKKGNRGRHDLKLTKRGRLMARLPLDPCIARMVLEAKERRVLHQVMVIAAALSIQDPRVRPLGQEKKADLAHKQFIEPTSDFITYLNIWCKYHHVSKKVKSRSQLRKFCRLNFLAYQRMREWCDIYEQISITLEEKGRFDVNNDPVSSDAIHLSVLSGVIRNIATRKEKNIYQGGQGKEVMIFPGSAQFGKAGRWIMAAEFVETSRLYARTIATINPQWLEKIAGSLCRYSYSDPHWEKKRGQVMASEKVSLFGMIVSAGRKVNFGPIDPKAAREIFIQTALVEGQVNQPVKFLDFNQQLINKLRDLEDRVRQRHVVDEYTIFQFYDNRIPVQVWDLATLGHLADDISLNMTENDILQQRPDLVHLQQFPEHMKIGEFNLKLFYKFSPSSGEDGVSVHIPAEAISHVSPTVFDWLVPGMLEEKIVFLIKGLPKAVRKKLVPVARSASVISDRVEFGEGGLLPSISGVIKQEYGLEIEKEQWRPEGLPNHLKMRFCLVNESAKVIKASRDFNELFSVDREPEHSSFLSLKRQFEVNQFEQFPDLPDKIPMRNKAGRLEGYAYPALMDNGKGKIGIRLFLSEEESQKHNRTGLVSLYKKMLPRQLKHVQKENSLPNSDWPLFGWCANSKTVNPMILHYIMLEVCEARDGAFPSRNSFEQRLTEQESGIFTGKAALLFEHLRSLLLERYKCSEIIAKYEKIAAGPQGQTRFAEYRQQLEIILPTNFLAKFSSTRMSQVPRFLKALQIRVERAHALPARDLEKRRLVAPFEEELNSLYLELAAIKIPRQHQEAVRKVEEFQLMVEELKVSTFAPELKTSIPVSAKRLKRKRLEIDRYL